jgi:hypothetical protein
LFHYFVDEDDSEFANEDRDETQGEALAKLIARKYHTGIYLQDRVQRHEAPVWTQFRDEATFVSGDIVDGAEDAVCRWLEFHHGRDIVVLDGSVYQDESEVGTTVPAFNQLMHLANTQREVLEEGVCRLYPNDTRAAMQFLNANQGDVIEGDAYEDTKWLAEGRILANELLNIPGFQKNFNLLVIKGASRFIHTNQLNLNNLYRLMAKLGRKNTRIVFVG